MITKKRITVLLCAAMSVATVIGLSLLPNKASADGISANGLLSGSKLNGATATYSADYAIEGIDGLAYSGYVLEGYEGSEFDLGTLDLTMSSTATPVISVLPQLKKTVAVDSYTESQMLAASGAYRFYIDFTSTVNQSKKFSLRFMPREADNSYETAITAAGENQIYTGRSFSANNALNPALSGTQMLRLDGSYKASARDIIDENNLPVGNNPKPINLYYDYAANEVYAGSGVNVSYIRRDRSGGKRFLIRQLSVSTGDTPWTKFTTEEASSVKVSLRMDTNISKAAKVMITAIGGTAVNEQTTINAISSVVNQVTAATPSFTTTKSVMLADNDCSVKLAEINVLTERKGEKFINYGTDSAGKYFAELSSVNFSLTDGINTMNAELTSRSSGTAQQAIWIAGLNSAARYGETLADNTKLTSGAPASENGSSLDGYRRYDGTIDENGKVLPVGACQSRYAIYYNSAENALYTDCGRNSNKVEFTGANGKTYYRWRIYDFDKNYNLSTVKFSGFGKTELSMTITVNGITDNTAIAVNYIDGQSLKKGSDGNVVAVAAQSSYMWLGENQAIAYYNEENTLPTPKTHTYLHGVQSTTQPYSIKLSDKDGVITNLSNNYFTPTSHGNYVAEYFVSDSSIGTISVTVGDKVTVENFESFFTKVGKNKDTYIHSMAYADLPSYMNFAGGGLLVETKNIGTDQTAHLFTQNVQGAFGLGIQFNNELYVDGNRFNSVNDYDSLIKLAFPGVDETYSSKAQALIYRVVIMDAEDSSKYVTAFIASNGGTDVAAVRAYGTGQQAGYVSDGTLTIPAAYGSGITLSGAYLDARSSAPIELCYDAKLNSLFYISGSRYALVRDFSTEYANDTVKFDGFPSGKVKISVGVDLPNNKNIVGGTAMPYGAFSVLGIQGQNFKAVGGNISENTDKLEVVSASPYSGGTVTIQDMNLYGVFAAKQNLNGGFVTISKDGSELLAKTAYTKANTFSASVSGDYKVIYTDGDITVSGILKVVDEPVYTISYLLNGGSLGDEVYTQTFKVSDTTITLPSVSKDDYEFAGWFNGNIEIENGDIEYAAENLVLSAKWEYLFGEALKAMNVGLYDEIGVKFYYEIPVALKNDVGAYLSVTVDEIETKHYIKDSVEDEKGRYEFRVDVAAAQMTEDIILQMVDGEGKLGKTRKYSVKYYADAMIASETTTAEQKEIIEAMLVYGAYAQSYFSVNTDKLANDGIVEDSVSTVTNDVFTAENSINGTANGLNFETYDLSLQSATKMIINFTIQDGSIDNYTFVVNYNNGKEVSKTLSPLYDEGQDRYKVTIDDIFAPYLDTVYTITVTNKTDSSACTIGTSAMSYARATVNSVQTSEAQKNLVKAMYLYNVAANAFFEN